MKKQLRTTILVTALVGSVSSVTTKVAAQYINPHTGNIFNNPTSSYLDTVIQGNMQMQNLMIQQSIQRNLSESSLEQQPEGTNQQTPESLQEATSSNEQNEEQVSDLVPNEENVSSSNSSTEVAATFFRPVARAVIPQQIAAKLGNTPEEKQEYEQNFTKLLEFYEGYVQERQWQLHDVAHAISYYIGANYYVSTDGKDLNPKQAWGLYNSVSKLLTEGKVLQNLSESEKQEMYEVMAIQGALPLLGYNSAVADGNKEMSAQFRQNARQNLEKLFGVPVAKVQFTDQGIVFQK